MSTIVGVARQVAKWIRVVPWLAGYKWWMCVGCEKGDIELAKCWLDKKLAD